MSIHSKKNNKEEQIIKNDKLKKNITKTDNKDTVQSELSGNKGSVQYWIEFSTNPQSEEDIREHLLDPKLRDAICITYICGNSKMSCKFIEELIALSTNIFDHGNYTEENKNLILQIFQSVDPKKTYMELKAQNLFIASLSSCPNERIDWFNIQKHQDLEPWFKEKYGHLFTNKVSSASKAEMSYWEN